MRLVCSACAKGFTPSALIESLANTRQRWYSASVGRLESMSSCMVRRSHMYQCILISYLRKTFCPRCTKPTVSCSPKSLRRAENVGLSQSKSAITGQYCETSGRKGSARLKWTRLMCQHPYRHLLRCPSSHRPNFITCSKSADNRESRTKKIAGYSILTLAINSFSPPCPRFYKPVYGTFAGLCGGSKIDYVGATKHLQAYLTPTVMPTQISQNAALHVILCESLNLVRDVGIDSLCSLTKIAALGTHGRKP